MPNSTLAELTRTHKAENKITSMIDTWTGIPVMKKPAKSNEGHGNMKNQNKEKC